MSAWNQKATKGEGNFEKAPVGNHPAVCVALIDLGTQENNYQGNVTWQRRVYLCWELTTEATQADPNRNHVIGAELTLSLNEKAKLRKWIEGRAGRQFPEGYEHDVSKELGKTCLLMVKEHNGYPRVDGMSAVPKGMTVPPAKLTPFIFSLDDLDTDDPKTPDFPPWLPYLFGDKLADVVLHCAEIRKVGPFKPTGDQTDGKEVTVPEGEGGEIPF